MSKVVPWSVKGVDFDAREAAKEAARRSGMPVGEWLNGVIADHANARGVHVDDVGDDERIAAVSKRIARMGDATQAATPYASSAQSGNRRSDAASERGRLVREEYESERARAPVRERSYRGEAPYRDEPPYREDAIWPRADVRALSRNDEEHFLELMAQRFEANAARSDRGAGVVDSLARRLESLEAQLQSVGAGRRGVSEQTALSEIDRKLENLGKRLRGPDETPPAHQDAPRAAAPPYSPPHPDLARLEAKLDSMASRVLGDRGLAERGLGERGLAARPKTYAPARRAEPKDNIALAIEEITRRQSALDGGRARPLVPRRGARFGADRFAGDARAPTPESAPIADLRNEIAQLASVVNEMRRDAAEAQRTLRESAADSAQVASLRNDVSVLLDSVQETRREAIIARPDADAPGDVKQIASLRRDVATLLDAVGEVQRATGAAQTPSPEIVELRRQIVAMGARIAQLAPRETMASLEGAVSALGRRVSTSRQEGVRDSIVEPIEGLILDLKRALADFAPAGTLRAIERQMLGMARNVEALASSGAAPHMLSRLHDQIADIHGLLVEAAATSGNVKHIEGQVADLAARVDRIAERGSTKAGSDAVSECIDDIRSELSRSSLASVFQALEQRIEALSRKIDEAVAQTASRDQVGVLSDRIEDVRRSVDGRHMAGASPPLDVARLEALMHDVQARLDRPNHDVAEVVQLQDLVRKLAQRIETAIAEGNSPAQLGGLERQVQDIFNRLDKSPLLPAGAERLEGLLHEVAERLERPVSPSQLDQVQQTIRLLAEKFEATVRANGAHDVLKGLEVQVAKMATRLEAPVSAELDTSRLEAMIQSLASRLERPGAGQAETSSRLEALMRDIAARLDQPQPTEDAAQMRQLLRLLAQRVEASRTEAPAYAALEEQIERLGARIDGADGADALASLERSISDIFAQMEQFRETALMTAEHAARKAAREALEAARPAEGGAHPAMSAMLTREISELRTMQDAAEKRTSATLNAVHETLERVVDRLAMIETDLDAEPAPRPGAKANDKASAFSAAPPTAQKVAPSAPRVAAPERAEPLDFAPAPPRAAAPTLPRADAPQAPPAPHVQAAARYDDAPTSAAGDIDLADLLMEPGSGKPARRDRSTGIAIPQMGAELNDAPTADPQASFIAAVRRAQNAAAARKGGEKPDAPDPTVEQSRARARAAATKSEQPAAPKLGALARVRTLLSQRKRQILFSVAGAAFIIGALQVIMSSSDDPPPLESGKQSSREQKLAQQKPGQQHPAQKMQANTPPKATLSATATSNDPATVGSIAAKTPQRAAPAAPPPQPPPSPVNLRSSANEGNSAAQLELGMRYAEGRGVTRDLALAASWMEKAARQDFAPAQYRLGALYEKGLGVPKDLDKARQWYQRAAERGNVRAMHNLAVLLADGASGKPDYSSAAQWFKQAAEFGVRDSQYNLAILNARGLGTSQNLAQSYAWFELASAQGDQDAGKKGADVATRMDARQLASARAIVESFQSKTPEKAANEITDPPGGWELQAETPKPAKPASTKARISQL